MHSPFDIWASLEAAEPFYRDCWAYTFQTEYNASTKETMLRPGCNATVVDFGGMGGIDTLGQMFGIDLPPSYVFHFLDEELYKLGYENGVNMVGAPYDFRRITGPEYTAQWTADLKALIEKTSAANGNKRVFLLCHSLGCPLTNRFLSQNVDQAWKDAHVESFITSSGVFGGSHKAVTGALFGNSEGIPSTSGNGFFQPLEAMIAGNTVMFPDPVVLTNASTQTRLIQVKTAKGTVTHSTNTTGFQGIFSHMATADNYLGLTSQAYVDTAAPYRAGFYGNPNVTTHVLHGTRQPSMTFIDSDETKGATTFYCENPEHPSGMLDCSEFGAAGNNKSYALPAYSTGDGTAVYDALTKVPQAWAKQGLKNVTIVPVTDTEHLGILYDWRYINYVLGVVTNDHSKMAEVAAMESEPDEGRLMREVAHRRWLAARPVG